MRKIVLLCAAGMSTSMLVSKMRKEAQTSGYECEIDAYSVADAAERGEGADILLLGPQVRYQLAKMQQQFPGKPVEAIDMTAYGTMNGKAVLDRVRRVLND